MGWIPGLGRSPGEGKGYPLQYSGLQNSMDCIVHGVAESDWIEQLSVSIPERDSVTNGELLLCLASLLRAESCLRLNETCQAQVGKRSQEREVRAPRSLLPPSAAPRLWRSLCAAGPQREGDLSAVLPGQGS